MKVKEQVMRWVFAATAAFSIAAVALICVFLFLNGLPFFTKYDLGAFLSGTTWKPANNIFGILPMIVGSLYVTGGALLFGAPVGILAGIYLARFCPVRLRKIIEPMIGLMAGVPSIVYGFFGLTTLVPLIREMFGGRGRGQCILTASLLLGIMILPTIIQRPPPPSKPCRTPTTRGHWRWARQMNAVCSARLSRRRNPAFWRRLCLRLAAPSARQWRSRWSSAISRA